jgi:tetratricopeptide (TPR) repeat protein
MEEPLEAMRQRFQMLRLEHKETLWGLKLLASAGVLPFTHHRLEVIFHNIFGRTLSLDDCLIVLAEQDFLRRPVQDPIQPEPAYLQDIVTYREGKTPADDFLALVNMFKAIKDAEGLLYVGVAFVRLNHHPQALTSFEEVLQLRPNDFVTWHIKGVVLAELRRREEALVAYARALQLRPDDAAILYHKGMVLAELRRWEEVLVAYARALQLRPDDAAAWINKGSNLVALGRWEEALLAYDRALQLRPDPLKV